MTIHELKAQYSQALIDQWTLAGYRQWLKRQTRRHTPLVETEINKQLASLTPEASARAIKNLKKRLIK